MIVTWRKSCGIFIFFVRSYKAKIIKICVIWLAINRLAKLKSTPSPIPWQDWFTQKAPPLPHFKEWISFANLVSVCVCQCLCVCMCVLREIYKNIDKCNIHVLYYVYIYTCKINIYIYIIHFVVHVQKVLIYFLVFKLEFLFFHDRRGKVRERITIYQRYNRRRKWYDRPARDTSTQTWNKFTNCKVYEVTSRNITQSYRDRSRFVWSVSFDILKSSFIYQNILLWNVVYKYLSAGQNCHC